MDNLKELFDLFTELQKIELFREIYFISGCKDINNFYQKYKLN